MEMKSLLNSLIKLIENYKDDFEPQIGDYVKSQNGNGEIIGRSPDGNKWRIKTQSNKIIEEYWDKLSKIPNINKIPLTGKSITSIIPKIETKPKNGSILVNTSKPKIDPSIKGSITVRPNQNPFRDQFSYRTNEQINVKVKTISGKIGSKLFENHKLALEWIETNKSNLINAIIFETFEPDKILADDIKKIWDENKNEILEHQDKKTLTPKELRGIIEHYISPSTIGWESYSQWSSRTATEQTKILQLSFGDINE